MNYNSNNQENASGFIPDNQASGFVSNNENNSGFITEKDDIPDNKTNASGFIIDEESGFVSNSGDNSGFIAETNSNSGFVSSSEKDSELTTKANDNSGFINNSNSKSISSSLETENLNSISGFGTHEATFTEIRKLKTSGAMSDMYSALQNGKRKVIIKRIKQEFRNNPEYVDLFYKEYENSLDITHINFVRVYGKGEDQEGPFFYMEYIDGRSLSEIISQNNKDAALFKKIFMEILDALSYLHKKQIYHRDLKPDNIMVTYKGDNVKIIDLGLAGSDNLQDNLKNAGTPKYSAPELQNNANKADQRADIYSLGLIILEFFTNSTNKKNVTLINDELLRKIVLKATDENIDNRYNNCDEIIKELSIPNNNPSSVVKNLNNSYNTIPKFLEEKISEFCIDGKLSQTEREYINLAISKHNLDPKEVDIYIKMAIEKALKAKSKTKIVSTKPNSSSNNSNNTVLVIIAIIAVALLIYKFVIPNETPESDKKQTATQSHAIETNVSPSNEKTPIVDVSSERYDAFLKRITLKGANERIIKKVNSNSVKSILFIFDGSSFEHNFAEDKLYGYDAITDKLKVYDGRKFKQVSDFGPKNMEGKVFDNIYSIANYTDMESSNYVIIEENDGVSKIDLKDFSVSYISKGYVWNKKAIISFDNCENYLPEIDNYQTALFYEDRSMSFKDFNGNSMSNPIFNSENLTLKANGFTLELNIQSNGKVRGVLNEGNDRLSYVGFKHSNNEIGIICTNDNCKEENYNFEEVENEGYVHFIRIEPINNSKYILHIMGYDKTIYSDEGFEGPWVYEKTNIVATK